MISQFHKSALRNPWFLAILGLIFVVFAVNATFIWLSTHNKSTLVDREYKSKDRKTGAEFLSELSSQQSLAWQVSLNRPKLVVLNEPTAYELTVLDKAGNPVRGELTIEAYRAADASKDFVTPFKEVSIGLYQGFISFPLKGYWELHIRIQRGEELYTVNTERFMVVESR